MKDLFRRFAEAASEWAGSPWAFGLAVLIIVVWAISGPILGFSDTWQLVINTATTLITFLMVFLIQASQNRSDRALHIKLDELLRAIREADTGKADVEQEPEDEQKRMQEQYTRMADDGEQS